MQLKVLGCTDSMGGPSAPVFGYLIELDNGQTLVTDLGPGAFAELQKVSDPAACDLLLTHVHLDHIADIPGLLVWRRFHPTTSTSSRNLLVGPGDIHDRIGIICQALGSEEDANLEDIFDQVVSNPGEPLLVGGGEADGGAVVTPYDMVHSVLAVGYRTEADGLTIAYTGDVARTDELAELTRDVGISIYEATWCSNEEGTPPGMHLTGCEVGKAATLAGVKELVLTHTSPYADGEEAPCAAKSTFVGDVKLAYLGMGLDG